MISGHDSVAIRTTVRILFPLVQLFGFYVVFHGHYSPGGGFQGGVIIAASYILIGLGLGRDELRLQVDEGVLAALAALGVLIFLGVGLVAIIAGGNFLDYSALTWLGDEVSHRRSWGIFLVESGVAVTVAAVLTLIFMRLTDREEE